MKNMNIYKDVATYRWHVYCFGYGNLYWLTVISVLAFADLNIFPEPESISLLSVGALALLWRCVAKIKQACPQDKPLPGLTCSTSAVQISSVLFDSCHLLRKGGLVAGFYLIN